MTPGDLARRFLRSRHWGALATRSASRDGHPYVSAVEFVLDHAARPLMLLSRLAEHTRNLHGDPRVSLLAAEPGPDAQARPRLTLLGTSREASADPGLLARYLRFFPESRRYLELGDFALYALEPESARYIAGFGEIRWIPADELLPPPADLAEREPELIERAGGEHLARLARHLAPDRIAGGGHASLVGVDCDGVDLRIDGTFVRADFLQTVASAAAAFQALAEMGRTP